MDNLRMRMNGSPTGWIKLNWQPTGWIWPTGCSLNIVFFFEDFKIFRTLASLFSLGVSVRTHTKQAEHQRCSRADRVQKNHNILRKNTILNEHPVPDDPRGVLDGVEQLEFKGHLPGAGSRLLGLVRNYFFLGMKHFHNPKTDLFSLSHFGGRH